MAKKSVKLSRPDGYKIELNVFETKSETVNGSILILHGMAEHYKRYTGFIEALNEAGYDAYIYNHRGHGDKLTTDELGFFAKKNGAELVIEDAVCAMQYVVENKRSEKAMLFGHSMGSMIARCVIQRYDKMDKVIICGTGFAPDAVCISGLAVSAIISLFGPQKKSPALDKIMFDTKEYKRDCKRTNFDWLTKDEAVVDAYIDDPACGYICSASFYHDLVYIMAHAKWGMANSRKDLPMFIVSGADDPVGSFGVGIRQLYDKYQTLGFTNVSMKLYTGDRHEILNETDKETVIADLIEFLNK